MSLLDIFGDLIDTILGTPTDITELGVDPGALGGSNQHITEIAETNPAAAQTLQMIDGVMTSSPEQLAAMEGQLAAANAGDQIMNSVAESHQDLLDSNAAHEATLATNEAVIYADSVSDAAENLIDRVESELGWT